MDNIKKTMCRAAATSLFTSIESLLSVQLNTSPISDEVATALTKLNLCQQHALIKRAIYFLSLSIDEAALVRQMKELDDMRTERELEDIYLLRRAPLALMRRLFGMHASEFTRRRGILSMKGVGNGRPPRCTDHAQREIWSHWQSADDLCERQRFLSISNATGLDLHMIWHVLREHLDG